jgi:transcriptional regulator with XRE-family HTH domain
MLSGTEQSKCAGTIVPGGRLWTKLALSTARFRPVGEPRNPDSIARVKDGQGFVLGGYPLSGIVRRVRRAADFSQRELAKHAQISAAAVAQIETGAVTPTLPTLQRILNAANFQLVVVDVDGRLVVPLEVWQDVEDGAGRRYPAHLDTILDPEFGDWWADGYGLARPPETFRRNRTYRDYERRRSQWQVRVKKLRHAPPPQLPRGWKPGDEWRTEEG